MIPQPRLTRGPGSLVLFSFLAALSALSWSAAEQVPDKQFALRFSSQSGDPKPRTFKTAAAGLAGLASSPEGKRFAALGSGGVIDLCETDTGRSLRQWRLGTEVMAVAFTPDGRGLVTANKDSTLYLLEVP